MIRTNMPLIDHPNVGPVWAMGAVGAELLLKLKSKWAWLLLAGLFMAPSVGLTLGVGMEAREASRVAGSAVEGGAPGAVAEQEAEHGLSQMAVEIARPLGFPVAYSMVVSCIVALGLIVFAQGATRKMQQVPEGAQNFLEWLVEGLYGFLEGIIGPHLVKRTFWFFATIFIFILSANWLGLIPGVGTIGWGHETSHGFKIDQPLLRGANADVNLTLAMALVFFACWIVWAIWEIGPLGVLKELFAPKGDTA